MCVRRFPTVLYVRSQPSYSHLYLAVLSSCFLLLLSMLDVLSEFCISDTVSSWLKKKNLSVSYLSMESIKCLYIDKDMDGNQIKVANWHQNVTNKDQQ